MTVSPGTYVVSDTDSGRAIDYYAGQTRIGTWDYHRGENQKWRFKPYPGSSGYAIQNVMTSKYIPMKTDGPYMNGVHEADSGIFTLEHQFKDFYLIKLMGTNLHLNHPYKELSGQYTPVGLTDKNTPICCFWRLEKVSDDSGGMLKPRREVLPEPSQPNTASSQGLGLYTDEAHLYTDMLFNMPRAPFTRVQRIAVLDWARKLSAINVPTIESFDECERLLETAAGNTNNLGRSG